MANPRAGPSQSSSVAFPRFDSSATTTGSASELTHNRYSTVSFSGTTGRFSINRASALELHDLIYGSGSALNLSNAENARAALDKLYEPSAVYSNPLLTASSGNVIKDIHSLMHQFTAVSLPTPISMLGRLFGRSESVNWLTIAKVWSEVGEVLESDVYDGHRRVVIEHTVYFLLLPDFLAPPPVQSDAMTLHASSSSLSLPSSIPSTPGPSQNRHPTLGSAARLLLTLARQVSLPVHTRLSFNDSGRITHHQDIWDVKDVLNLVPGVGAAQWISSRMFAYGLSSAFDLCEWATSASGSKEGSVKQEGEETPRGHVDSGELGGLRSRSERSQSSSSVGINLNALGLHLSDRLGGTGRNRAPDTDYGD